MFATLVLEILDTRLLSVLTWYHLSFLAVSLAMLGMAAGAVRVFLGGDRFSAAQAPAVLPRYCAWLAISVPATHLANLCIPIPVLTEFSLMEITAVAVATSVLAIPFVLSGVVVTLALTRTSGQVGRLYAADLGGAAFGCLAVIALLNWSDITSVAFAAGAAAAMGAWAFHRFGASGSGGHRYVLLAVACAAIALTNGVRTDGFGIIYPKNRSQWLAQRNVEMSAWNSHSYITVQKPQTSPAFLWGPGIGADRFTSTIAWVAIDGEAGTPITQWDGRRESIDWVQYDVTALVHHMRRGRAAVIGVGGGRDVLSALWGGSTVTGIEVNGILVNALRGRYRDFARLATRSDVTLVHDEARSYLSRHAGQFDLLQMSLIDTWAATGAGAFSLSENGLYTREAWQVFLTSLAPGGVFSVSRWFAPGEISEATRVMAMATSVLLQRGVANPSRHIIMVSREKIATMLVSVAPFTDADRVAAETAAGRFGFTVIAAPWQPASDARMARILAAPDETALAQATADDVFDFSPATDSRPFFFSMLKPRAFLRVYDVPRGGVMWGNLRATVTLVVLFGVASLLVALIVGWPLLRAGRPPVNPGTFRWGLLYFAAIGCGFMFIQIPFLQRFSVYLGHPTYSLAIILFTMILAAGAGSFVSDRIPADGSRARRIPIAIAVLTAAIVLLLQPVAQATVSYGLVARSMVVVLFVAPIAFLLGFCFPIGMRLVGRSSSEAAAWMWGINGATGVLGSIIAVAISMWISTHASFIAAGLLYLLLPVALAGLARHSVHA
jgi:SAM-dependent methyltransferase